MLIRRGDTKSRIGAPDGVNDEIGKGLVGGSNGVTDVLVEKRMGSECADDRMGSTCSVLKPRSVAIVDEERGFTARTTAQRIDRILRSFSVSSSPKAS